jgi:hypothetical protein
MARWGELAKNRSPSWDKPLNLTGYESEIADYWRRIGKGTPAREIIRELGKKNWDEWVREGESAVASVDDYADTDDIEEEEALAI